MVTFYITLYNYVVVVNDTNETNEKGKQEGFNNRLTLMPNHPDSA
jgi:hypothetical protein